MRDAGNELGYDSHSSNLPTSLDVPYIEMISDRLPELRNDADRLRDSLDATLDAGKMFIKAMIDINAHGLKCGEHGHVPTRQAREMIRSHHAEAADEQAQRRSRLQKLA